MLGPDATLTVIEDRTASTAMAFKLDTGEHEYLKRWVSGAKIVLLPLGVAALCYWASQERSIRPSAGWHGSLLLGVLISQISIYVFALRFRRVMNIVGLRIGVIDSLKIHTLSMFYHFFVPLSIGAEVTKFVKLRAFAPDRGPMLTAGGIVLDHMIGLGALMAISIGLLVALEPVVIDFHLRILTIVIATGMAVGATVVLRSRIGSSSEMKDFLNQLRGHKADLLSAFGLSLVMQLLLAAAVFAGSLGWGLHIGYSEILFVLTGAFIFQAIPFNFAGVGVAELAGTGLYVALGLPLSDAVLLVSLMYCYRILMALIGGLWELLATQS